MRNSLASAPGLGDPPHELKWLFPAHSAAVLEPFLSAVLRPDPVHPAGPVESVYFDSPGLDSLEEKRASDYFKTKIRIRWYDRAGPAFWEVKRRIGTRREKLRGEVGWSGAEAADRSLEDVRWLALPAALRSQGLVLAPDLRPTLQVGYRRRRFVDPFSGARVALDEGISAPRVAARLGGRSTRELPWAVVDVKNARAGLAGPLISLAALGGRRASFSKYGALFEVLGV